MIDAAPSLRKVVHNCLRAVIPGWVIRSRGQEQGSSL
jgi:hypothetical protein